MRLTKGQINRAGQILRRGPGTPKYQDSLLMMQTWRSMHSEPLKSITKTLRDLAPRSGTSPLIAHRLKRTSTIIQKLQAMSSIELSQIQDIAGARIVLEDCSSVRQLVKHLDEIQPQKEIKGKDYIGLPKSDGYRSIHRVLHVSGADPEDLSGLLVEVQVRTRIQHAWATAVETVGTILRQNLKSNQGNKEWLSLFRHIGSAFAYLEGEKADPAISLTKVELFRYVIEEASRLGMKEKMRSFQKALAYTSIHSSRHLHLLHLKRPGNGNDRRSTLKIRSYLKEEAERAQIEYVELERTAGPGSDVVLVSAATTSALPRVYPNYFLDSTEFLSVFGQVSDFLLLPRGTQYSLPNFSSPVGGLSESMPSLESSDRVNGYKVAARVLWALELASRAGLGPVSASEISKLLNRHSNVRMHDTNVARFFRENRGDETLGRLWSEVELGRSVVYSISPEGRRELLSINIICDS